MFQDVPFETDCSVQVEKRQPWSTGVPLLGITKNFLRSCSVPVAHAEKNILRNTNERIFLEKSREGKKKKPPPKHQKSLLFETFSLINLKYKSNSWSISVVCCGAEVVLYNMELGN